MVGTSPDGGAWQTHHVMRADDLRIAMEQVWANACSFGVDGRQRPRCHRIRGLLCRFDQLAGVTSIAHLHSGLALYFFIVSSPM